ncbi:MAG: DNA alkylation repair protein [Candidatus Nealsonbacteria bacterium]|nr:MAG: DNA alkylation repair protein [Candidatus Nealsonbacteria bacterium]
MFELIDLKKELKSKASVKKSKNLQRFFKTEPGEYGERDIFLGIKVGDLRKIAEKYKNLSLKGIEKLLYSKIHEERLVALLILVQKFQTDDERLKEKIFKLYLKNTNYINNWDLVDLSADKIIGEYLSDKPREVLYKLAMSKNLWERRIAIMSTFQFIKNNEFKETLKILEMLLEDGHDLIHKAAGWMLREIGKRSLETEEKFLKKHYQKMPRTMLRYAIERFPEKRRQAYLKGKI